MGFDFERVMDKRNGLGNLVGGAITSLASVLLLIVSVKVLLASGPMDAVAVFAVALMAAGLGALGLYRALR